MHPESSRVIWKGEQILLLTLLLSIKYFLLDVASPLSNLYFSDETTPQTKLHVPLPIKSCHVSKASINFSFCFFFQSKKVHYHVKTVDENFGIIYFLIFSFQ